MNPMMAVGGRANRSKVRRYRRARVRHFLLTLGPDRLSGGRLRRRHLAQEFLVRQVEIRSSLWPHAFDGLRIGHVSDFHVGDLHPAEHALQALDCLEQEKVDLVACTGDVVDLHVEQAVPVVQALGAMSAPLGSHLVLGNHDELHDPDVFAGMAIESGVNVMANVCTSIECRGSLLSIAGIGWAKTASQCARNVDRACAGVTNGVHLLLAHNPKAFVEASDLGVALTLSGHTHGGQVAMKSRRNANLAISYRRSAGLFRRNGSALFVTTGVGAWFPLRVNCPPEIAILTMRCN